METKKTDYSEQSPAQDGTKHMNETEEEDDDEVFDTNWTDQVESFDELGLKEEVLRGIYGYGFEKPSQIQKIGILPVISGRDTIAQGQSGTGKTATFTISVL